MPTRSVRYPPSPVHEVRELLHGETIADPYRWLEDGKSAETRAWTEAQNAFTASWLDSTGLRDGIRRRLEALLTIGSIGVPSPARGRYFYQRRDGSQNQPVLYVRDGVTGGDRALVDPNALNSAGTTALDWYFPSDDGALLAYGLSEDGSEQSVLRLLEVRTGAPLTDAIPGTRAADLAWLPDRSAFYYTRYPRGGEVPVEEASYHRAVYFHRLGEDPARDPLIFKPAEKEHWPGVGISPDGRWVVISVARTFDATDLYLLDREQGGAPRPVVKDLPALFEAQVVRGRMYVRTNLGAPTYRLYAADPASPDRAGWREIVASKAGVVLDGAVVTGAGLVLSYLERACSRLVLADADGGGAREVQLPTLGSVFGVAAEWDGLEAFYGFSSFTVPPAVYRIDLVSGEQTVWRRVVADVDPARYEVGQVTYPSKDGTPVTMFLVQPRGLRPTGSQPVYLSGYGGFNISMSPAFSRTLLLWLERGGVVAIPNLRGGGEYGETWHRDGMLDRKQNTIDDFIAAAEWLVREGWTNSSRLAAAGGSNGGLLMGAALTQRPELFRAVVVQVPLLDMLRYHRFLIARLWIPEYGSPDDPEQFRWLRAYSPYHHVREGTAYPAILLATAEQDTRVDPMHARKMAARLQAATVSERPVLLRLETRAGHGAGKPIAKSLEELADVWTFVCAELGVSANDSLSDSRSPDDRNHASDPRPALS